MYHLVMRIRGVLALVALACGLGGCGKEAGRVPFKAEGTGSVVMMLNPGDVAFWTDIDLEYEGDSGLTYQIELVQKNLAVAVATCDPLGHLGVKTGWVSTDLGNKHTRSGGGKMSCDVKLPTGAETTVNVKLVWSKKPTSVNLKKADLVVKQ